MQAKAEVTALQQQRLKWWRPQGYYESITMHNAFRIVFSWKSIPFFLLVNFMNSPFVNKRSLNRVTVDWCYLACNDGDLVHRGEGKAIVNGCMDRENKSYFFTDVCPKRVSEHQESDLNLNSNQHFDNNNNAKN